jgi:AmmeMemoRadiSam system protein B
MTRIRRPAVAGSFYPADPAQLAAAVDGYVAAGRARLAHLDGGRAPKAIIAPHAGYVYSGPIAGSAYAAVAPEATAIERVVLLGPAHRVAVDGLAASSADAFATPLGDVAVDRPAIDRARRRSAVAVDDTAHAAEHSLEVHLPFMQRVLTAFTIVPFAVGDASHEAVADVLEDLWGGRETLIVVSSDLSHYHDYATANRLDADTAEAIEHLDADRLGGGSACGRIPIGGLLVAAKRRHLHVHRLDLRNSGDTAGPRDEVVGYGAFAIT